MAAEAKIKQIPWTEKFRPRSLDEVILTRKQREQIENWWRKWIVWWNMRLLWFQNYSKKWREFIRTNEGKSWQKSYYSKWRDFFKKKFETIVSQSALENIFETIGKQKKKMTLNLRPNALPAILNMLKRVWSDFVEQHKVGKSDIIPPFPPYKPILLVGPPGTGKTSSIYALAWQEGLIVVEFNASDKRSGSIIKEVVREATMNIGFASMEGALYPPRIILLDEVDGLHGREDRGGFAAILRLIDETKLPIAFTANVMHDRKVRMLMMYCETVFFDRPADYQVEKLINMISKRVGFTVPDDVKNYLKRYAPDFRTVVSALETYYYSGKLPYLFHDQMISLQDAIRMGFGLKVYSDGEIDVLKTAERVLTNLSNVEEVDPPTLILWVWENASNFVDKEKLFEFYKFLSLADYLYKIGARRGNWRIAYRDAMNYLALAMAKCGKPVKSIWELRKIRVVKPTIVEALGKIKQLMEGVEVSEGGEVSIKQFGLRPLLERYARKTHISRKRAWHEMKFVQYLAEKKPELVGQLFAQLYIPEDTIEIFLNHFLKGKKEIHKKVLESYRDNLGKIGPRVVTLKGMEREEVEEKKEEEKKEEEEKVEEKKVKKEEEKKGEKKKVTLDEFFSK